MSPRGVAAPAHAARPRSGAAAAVFATLLVLAGVGFAALGHWQLERRVWKLDLIARVEQRAHASPVEVPARSAWPAVGRARDEYRRVRLSGTFLHDAETLVHTATALGTGYWVLTPLQTADRGLVLVNRGFVPPERRAHAARRSGEPQGAVTITGRLRLSEPGGGPLRRNRPVEGRWYSRDVAAIAAARRLSDVAPFFVDAEPPAQPAATSSDQPVAGLTVLRFRNNHLVYAITWFGLALMSGAGALLVAHTTLRQRRRSRVGAAMRP